MPVREDADHFEEVRCAAGADVRRACHDGGMPRPTMLLSLLEGNLPYLAIGIGTVQ